MMCVYDCIAVYVLSVSSSLKRIMKYYFYTVFMLLREEMLSSVII